MSDNRPQAGAATPRGWRRLALGEAASRVTTKNSGRNENVLTISAQHGLVSQSEFFSRRVASEDTRGYYYLEKGDFAYNKSYSAGFPVGVIRPLERYPVGVVSPLYICFRRRVAVGDFGFLRHYLAAGLVDDQIALLAKEGARNHGLLNVGVSDFFSVELDVPPLPEQQRIAEILDTLDEAIRKTEQVIAKLQQVKQGLLHDLLTRGIDEHGELRDPDRHPEQFKDSELGRVPRGWEVATVGGHLDRIEVGSSPSCPDQPAPAGAWGVLKVSAVHPDGFRGNENKTIALPSQVEPAAEVRDGDLLMTRANTPDLVGLTCFVVSPRPLLMLCDKTLRLVVSMKSDTRFMSYALQMPYVRRQVEMHATGSSGSMKNISQAAIRGIAWLAPPKTEQLLIAQVLEHHARASEVESGNLTKLRNLKSALMRDLLTGQVRTVPVER